MSDDPRRKTNTTALISLLAGVFGFCFAGVGGIVAVVLGIVAHAEIRRTREDGAALATAGIVLGGIHLLGLLIAGVIAMSPALLLRGHVASSPWMPPPPSAVSPAPAPSSAPARSRAATEQANGSRETSTRETPIGKLRLIDLRAEPSAQHGALSEQAALASQAGERLLLFVVAPDCLPCNGFMLALTDPRLQGALASVRLIRVDAAEFGAELAALGLPLETVPGFALMGSNLRVLDYIHGGEWDADIADNIAPVLTAFVRGKYLNRRHKEPERARADETRL